MQLAHAQRAELRQRFKPQTSASSPEVKRNIEDENSRMSPQTQEEATPMVWVLVLVLLLLVMGGIVPMILSKPHLGFALTDNLLWLHHANAFTERFAAASAHDC